MIECPAVKENDIKIAALVIGMTLGAVLLCRIGPTAVKARARPAVSRNVPRGRVFVAREAEPRLRFSRERLVALRTVLFKLGMSFDNWSRADESFE